MMMDNLTQQMELTLLDLENEEKRLEKEFAKANTTQEQVDLLELLNDNSKKQIQLHKRLLSISTKSTDEAHNNV